MFLSFFVTNVIVHFYVSVFVADFVGDNPVGANSSLLPYCTQNSQNYMKFWPFRVQ